MGVALGDWVVTRHGYTGRVFAIHHECPESDEWIEMQAIPVTQEQRDGLWVSVLVHGGGSVCSPITSVERVRGPVSGLQNDYASMYFRDEQWCLPMQRTFASLN